MTKSAISGQVPVLRVSERTILHLLRMRGALSKAELSRLSNMSAQGVSIIVERLLDLGLVSKGEKKRGRVGQPSTPIVLDPEGAVSLGVFIDTSKAHLIVADFQGTVRAEQEVRYESAKKSPVAKLVFEAARNMPDRVGEMLWKRCVGIGLAASESLLHLFCHDVPNPAAVKERQSLAYRLEEEFDLPTFCVNDIRAACVAELSTGSAYTATSTLYLNLGPMLGAGLILEGRLIGPENQLASSLHYLPMPEHEGKHVGDFASLDLLRDRVEEQGFDFAGQLDSGFCDTRKIFEGWRADMIDALVVAIRAASATLTVDRVLVASSLQRDTLAGLLNELRYTLKSGSDSRVRLPELSMDTACPSPCAQGTAMVPFFKVFGPPGSGMIPAGGMGENPVGYCA